MTLDSWPWLYWSSLAALAYVYFGYPALLALGVRMARSRAVRKGDAQPPVTLIISAYNEEAVIEEKLTNSLALDYPADRLEILVVSDASSDRTDAIVESFAGNRVKLHRMPERSGKTLGLNEAIRLATGEIVVFSDANAHYRKDAIARLIRNFSDPDVGAVTGESRYRIDDDDLSTESENAYWKYELWLKKRESALGSLIGGDGAIYAIRRSLYRDMDASDLSDFVNPLQIVSQGYRNLYEPEAVSHESGAEDFAAEFRRKVRIVNRAWRATWKMRSLLNPARHGWFALQFLSHKVLRWLAPVFMIVLFVANAFMWRRSGFYAASLVAQTLFYGLALAGWRLASSRWRSKLITIPHYFCSVNLASLIGILDAARGRTYTTWNSSRREKALERDRDALA